MIPGLVWPMYTLDIDIGNIWACCNIGESASTNRWYRFCKKNSKQRATTSKSDPCQPPQTTIQAADRRGGRRCEWSSGGRRREGHCNCQVSHAIVVTRNWSLCYLRVVDGMAALCRRLAVYSRFFRQQMTVVEKIISDLHHLSNDGHLAGLCVFV